MSVELDEIGKRLLELLKQDGRLSFVDLGKKLGLSEAAVRRRVANMVRDKIITKFTIETNTGPQANAISLISVAPNIPTPEVSRALKKIKGIDIIYEITGEYDIATVIVGSNIAELNLAIDEIRKLAGVADTNTVVVLKVLR